MVQQSNSIIRNCRCSLSGVFNVYNLLAVYGATVLLGQNPDEALRTGTLKPVSGRFETLRSPGGYTAVSINSTPDALTNVLEAVIHEVLEGNGRV